MHNGLINLAVINLAGAVSQVHAESEESDP